MFISLGTVDVWEVETGFDANQFFLAVHVLCLESDLLVIGAYNPGAEALHWLVTNERLVPNDSKPFSDSFEHNRKEFPLGKAYPMYAEHRRLVELSILAQDVNGSLDKKLFFDHVLIYRPGEPILPILDYHDAFTGGQLYLSGHYSKTTAQGFADYLGVTTKLVVNPASTTVSPYA